MTTQWWQVQRAVYLRLTGNSALMAALSGGVYDHPREDAALPYLYIEQTERLPWRGMGEAAAEVTLRLQLVVGGRSRVLLDALIRQIETLLHAQSFTMDQCHVVQCRIEQISLSEARLPERQEAMLLLRCYSEATAEGEGV